VPLELAGNADLTRCCGAMFDQEERDGVTFARCAECRRTVWRINPRTHNAEWATDGTDVFTTDDASIPGLTMEGT